MSKSLTRILDLLATTSGQIAGAVVFIMVIMVATGAIMRYGFDRPLPFPDEYSGYMLVLITLVGAGYVLRERGHINVDIVIRMLPPRVAGWLTVVTDLASLLCVIVLILQTVNVVSISFATGRESIMGSMRTPLGPVQLLMPIGLVLLAIEFLRVLSRSIRSACQKLEVRKQGGE